METTSYTDVAMKLAPIFEALSHPARIQILMSLSDKRECPAGTISAQLPLCKSTVSQHMAKLKEAGLISCTPEGVCQNYRIQNENLSQFTSLYLEFLQQLDVSAKLQGQFNNRR
jgi:ArsR family transcriptional regulator